MYGAARQTITHRETGRPGHIRIETCRGNYLTRTYEDLQSVKEYRFKLSLDDNGPFAL